MSANPYDALPWWTQILSGAGADNVYDTVIVTNVSAARQAAVVTAAAAAVAQTARAVAAQGAAQDAVVYAARVKAQEIWRANTGSDQGYSEYEPSIFDQAASWLNSVRDATGSTVDTVSQTASAALRSVSVGTVGALFGSAGTVVLLGAGALILLVLLKR